MSFDALERPVWRALTGPQAHLATQRGDAVRIDPEFGFFAASADGGAGDDLAELVRETGRDAWLLEATPVVPPRGLLLSRTAPLTQMVSTQRVLDVDEDGIEPLGDADAEEMYALAHATEPGPWEIGTHRYGGYYGVRAGGRLAAMAGTRLRPDPKLAEVSGVCTYPEARGRGYAKRLMLRVMRDMAERGETPFLHCYSSNERAIALYRALGFEVTRELIVSVLQPR